MVNLIVNAEAETGATYGWIGFDTAINTGWITVQTCSHNGIRSFGTECPTTAVIISQVLTLGIWATHTLSIWVKNHIGEPCSLVCSIDKKTLISGPSASTTYTRYSFGFTASSITETLQIIDRSTYMVCTEDISITLLSGSYSFIPTAQLSVSPFKLTEISTGESTSLPSVQINLKANFSAFISTFYL